MKKREFTGEFQRSILQIATEVKKKEDWKENGLVRKCSKIVAHEAESWCMPVAHAKGNEC